MMPLSLSVVLAVAFAPPVMHGSEAKPSAADALAPAIPALYTPSDVTPSGREFIEHCDDEAFAKARSLRMLAERCERLLRRWHGEASGHLDSRTAPGPGIEQFGAPRFLPPPSPMRAASGVAG
jgi:hypothetical protein